MPIQRRLAKRRKIPLHQQGVTFGDRPPQPLPNVMLPYTWGSNHSFKLPKKYGKRRTYIGHILPLHLKRSIKSPEEVARERDPDYERKVPWYSLVDHQPTSGYVGFAVWIADTMTYCRSDGNNKFSWWGLDTKQQRRMVCFASHAEYMFYKFDTFEGEVPHKFLGLFTATDEQERQYWRDRNSRDGVPTWPDWLHKLEAKAYRALYKQAEKQFGIHMPWGLYKGSFL